MTTNRKHETYRNHDLISAFFKGEFGGRVIQRGKTLLEISGGGIDENLVELRAFVDQRMAELTAEERTALQASADAVRDLCAVVDRLLTA